MGVAVVVVVVGQMVQQVQMKVWMEASAAVVVVVSGPNPASEAWVEEEVVVVGYLLMKCLLLL